jgi:hypothetical protein
MKNIKQSNLIEEILKLQSAIEKADYTKNDAYQTLERVNFWLNNFDMKASYFSAIIGIIGTILFSNNYFCNVDLKKWCGEIIVFNVLFLLILISFLLTMLFLLWCINPTIKNIKPSNPQVHTILFYGSIADEKINNIKNIIDFSESTIIRDINNQAYFCSIICMNKRKKILASCVFMLICILSFVLFEVSKHLI